MRLCKEKLSLHNQGAKRLFGEGVSKVECLLKEVTDCNNKVG